MQVVLAGSASRPFALRLARDLGCKVAAAEAKRFPDGEAHVRVADDVRGKHVVVVQSTAPDANLVELLLWQDAVREAGASRVTTVIPYLGYARQDRVFAPGEALSIRAVGRAIAAGSDQVVTVDPHKPDVLAFLGPGARLASAVPELAAALGAWGVDAVLAPDKGARPRAEEAAGLLRARVDHLEKTRLSSTEVEVRPKALDVRGARVAILDDLIASGSTVVTAAAQLRAQGAKAVFAACTHGLFTNGAVQRLRSGGVDRVLCTDTTAPAPGCEVVSAAPAVARLLLRPTS